MEKKDIKSFTIEELAFELEELGEKAFRTKQIYSWMHEKLARDFNEMTDLSNDLRERLSSLYNYTLLKQLDKIEAKDGTCKFLFGLKNGHVIESVLMKYHHGNSVCISSQLGCRMACKFCASTIGGLERNLTASEMLEQIYQIQRVTGERVSNVVVMGTGEPMDNYENLVRFIRLISSENGLHISQRNITVSTCGLPEEMLRFAKEGFQVTLALSLHAPNDDIRKRLMPVAIKHSLIDVIAACDEYYNRTGRRITFEYSLIRGVNDLETHAEQLCRLLKGKNCHVNLIPINEIQERGYKRSESQAIQNFKNILEKNKINVTIRREMGLDINAACGQLRKSYIEENHSLGGSRSSENFFSY